MYQRNQPEAAFIKVSRIGYAGPEPIMTKQAENAGVQLTYVDFVPNCMRGGGLTGQASFQDFQYVSV